jgi:hypothetical protein
MAANEEQVGEGKTLEEAIENFASKKAAGLLADAGDSSLREGLDRFEQSWFPIAIEVQVRPHNQWVRGYRVRDGSG